MSRNRSKDTIAKDAIRMRNRLAHNRAVVQRYKRAKGCSKCGYNTNAFALEFNHIDYRTKHRTVVSNLNGSWDRIKKEIAKCEILCSNCHQIETLCQTSPTRQRQRA